MAVNTLPGDWQLQCDDIRVSAGYILNAEMWTDCSFMVGSEQPVELKAHKLILAMSSPVFQAMFYGLIAERDSPIRIPDMEDKVFKTMIEYMYTNKINTVCVDVLMDLVYGARKYMLPKLADKCIQKLSGLLTPDNVCQIYEFGINNENLELTDNCEMLIKNKTMLVLNTKHFLKLNLATVEKIFSFETMNIANELELIDAAERYNNGLIQNRESASEQTDTAQHQSDDKGCDCDDTQPIHTKSSKQRSKKTYGPAPKISKTGDSGDCHSGIMVDRPILPVLRKIRFLTLTAKELSGSKSFVSLLTHEEMAAILVNANGENTLNIPDGFSTNRIQRNIRLAIRLIVPNIRQLKDNALSSTCYVGSLPWKIVVVPRRVQKYLGIFIKCEGKSCTPDWSCEALTELRILSHKLGVPDLCRKLPPKTFNTYVYVIHLPNAKGSSCGEIFTFERSNKEDDWGYAHFILHADLTPEKGYVSGDGCITIEANVHVTHLRL